MIGTVRTSYTLWGSQERLDDPAHERERYRFDEFSLRGDEDFPMVCGQGGHDILMLEPAAEEVARPVELDSAVAVDLTHERDMALGDREGRVSVRIPIVLQREGLGQMAESRPEPGAKDSRESGPVFHQLKATAGLLKVVIGQEAPATATQGSQIRTTMPENALLPESIEAFDGGVAPGLSPRDEDQMDAQEQMQPYDLGEAVWIAPASGGGHFVIHLGDGGYAHNSPAINEMPTEGEGLLVGVLRGCGGLPGRVEGVEGVISGDSPGTSKISRADQVGLMKIAHSPGGGIRIERPCEKTGHLALFGSPGTGEDLFDRREGGKLADASHGELVMDRFRAHPRESRPAGLVGLEFVAEGKDLADEPFARPVSDMERRSASIQESVLSADSIAADPLRQPSAASTGRFHGLFETSGFFIIPNSSETDLIFALLLHRRGLLPSDLGRSLSEMPKSSRCPYGFSVYDVLTETPYLLTN